MKSMIHFVSSDPLVTFVIVASLLGVALAGTVLLAADQAPPDQKQLEAMSARFASVEIRADVASLPANERQALAKLVDAARVMDALFLRQSWAGNEAKLVELARRPLAGGPGPPALLPDQQGPVVAPRSQPAVSAGVPSEKPEEANFYPAGASKADVERWIGTLPGPEQAKARGFFTTIRRTAPGSASPFQLVPYSLEYQGELGQAARLLREAAALTTQPTLKRFLETRAAAFLSDDYYASDVAWMELDASIEPTIGPYEVYEDAWFNYKAAFEAFITLRDDAETAKLQKFGAELQDIENHLPIDPSLRNPALGALAPIRVVNVVFTAGDGNRGVQTAAFNLPNDERVIREKGSKRVMLKNVQEAKFRVVLQPISMVALAPADRKKVSFDAFFTHILMHELMHGLGPHDIVVGGRKTTVRQELKETYSAIEEAKADISGLWSLHYLVDKGVVPAAIADSLYDTFLASAFRSIRFGITEAHGRGIAIQLNYLLDKGAVTVAPDGTFAIASGKVRGAVEALTREIMTLQAAGDYAAARKMIETLGVVRPEVQRVLDRLAAVPVDIAPHFTSAAF